MCISLVILMYNLLMTCFVERGNSFSMRVKDVLTRDNLVVWCWMWRQISLSTPANALPWLAAPWMSVRSWCWITLATNCIQWTVFVTVNVPSSTCPYPNRRSCDGYVVIIVPVALPSVGASNTDFVLLCYCILFLNGTSAWITFRGS